MLKFLKMLIGLMLLPACWAVSVATYNLYRLSGESVVPQGFSAWALPAGFLIWALIYFLLPRPTRAYVLGHELTHALWALIMGGRIGELKVNRDGGHVALTKTNFIITLAPYFFPFYTFLVIGSYYLAGLWFEAEAYRVWWLGAVGFTWSFHITFTVNMLTASQPDIQEHGRLFSYTVIYFMNILAIGVWMVLVGNPKIGTYSELLAHEHAVAYKFTWSRLVSAWIFVAQWIKQLQ